MLPLFSEGAEAGRGAVGEGGLVDGAPVNSFSYVRPQPLFRAAPAAHAEHL
jgi:hypothetical protein